MPVNYNYNTKVLYDFGPRDRVWLVNFSAIDNIRLGATDNSKRTPEDDPARIDEEWEEAPVTFLAAGAHEMGGPTGVVAKIRASNRAKSREAGK